jgi:hypothetical protein
MKKNDTIAIEIDEPKMLEGEHEPKSLEDLSKDELIELIMKLVAEAEMDATPEKKTYIVEPFEISEVDIITSDEFNEGLLLGYKLGGLYNALVSSGLSKEASMDIVVNEHTYTHSGAIVKEQSKIARNGSIR